MTDRDRLAADLHANDCICDGIGSEAWPYHLMDADRLIALGWTRLDEEAFIESIGLTCCPHTEPASLREHVENEGFCVVCREYVAHTDDGQRLVAWPCPTVQVRNTIDEERLARALHAYYHAGALDYDHGAATVYCREDATDIAKAYREDTDHE